MEFVQKQFFNSAPYVAIRAMCFVLPYPLSLSPYHPIAWLVWSSAIMNRMFGFAFVLRSAFCVLRAS
jgi:hypothetical protein